MLLGKRVQAVRLVQEDQLERLVLPDRQVQRVQAVLVVARVRPDHQGQILVAGHPDHQVLLVHQVQVDLADQVHRVHLERVVQVAPLGQLV